MSSPTRAREIAERWRNASRLPGGDWRDCETLARSLLASEARVADLEKALRELTLRAGVATDKVLPVSLEDAYYRQAHSKGQSDALFAALQAARTLLAPAPGAEGAKDG